MQQVGALTQTHSHSRTPKTWNMGAICPYSAQTCDPTQMSDLLAVRMLRASARFEPRAVASRRHPSAAHETRGLRVASRQCTTMQSPQRHSPTLVHARFGPRDGVASAALAPALVSAWPAQRGGGAGTFCCGDVVPAHVIRLRLVLETLPALVRGFRHGSDALLLRALALWTKTARPSETVTRTQEGEATHKSGRDGSAADRAQRRISTQTLT